MRDVYRKSKPFPPYGKRIDELLRAKQGLSNFSGCTQNQATIWIATGRHAWEFQSLRPNHLVVVLPDETNATSFNWRFLCGHEPILLTGSAAESRDRRRQIAAAMFQDGVSKVLAGRMLMVAKPANRTAA